MNFFLECELYKHYYKMPPLHDMLPFLYETKKKPHKLFNFMQGIYHKAIDKSLKRKGSKNNISRLEQYNKF